MAACTPPGRGAEDTPCPQARESDAGRNEEGADSRLCRASVPDREVRVRFRQGALQRPGEEHKSGDHAVRTRESVPRAKAFVASDRQVASAVRVRPRQPRSSAQNRKKIDRNLSIWLRPKLRTTKSLDCSEVS